jgi:hypothetical protein
MRRLSRIGLHLTPTNASGGPFDGARGGVNDNYDDAPQPSKRLLVSTVSGELYDDSNFEEATIFSPEGHCDYYGSKGFLSGSVALREALLRIPIDELAPATVPAVCRPKDVPPALWGPRQWRELEERQRREPLFDWAKVMKQYEAQDYRRDGFCAFEGIMTLETAENWSAALIELQEQNDRLVLSDWRESIDWEALRVQRPTAVFTDEQKAAALGGAQQLRGMDDSNGGFASRLHGLLPEYFPPGHSSYLMFVLFHPQMLALHSLVLEAEEVFYATAQSNCKSAGTGGSRWHSHGGMPRFNDCRVRTPAEYLVSQRFLSDTHRPHICVCV